MHRMDASHTHIDKTISILQANLYGMILVLPLLLMFVLPYALLWGTMSMLSGLLDFIGNLPILILILVTGTLAHELLHGITWKIAGRLPKGTVEYNIKWALLTPYAHLKVPVPLNTYRIGGIMPGLVLGILPGIIALTTGTAWLLWFGIIFSWAAVGDYIILWLLRDLPPASLILDHPEKVGCTILVPENSNERTETL